MSAIYEFLRAWYWLVLPLWTVFTWCCGFVMAWVVRGRYVNAAIVIDPDE